MDELYWRQVAVITLFVWFTMPFMGFWAYLYSPLGIIGILWAIREDARMVTSYPGGLIGLNPSGLRP